MGGVGFITAAEFLAIPFTYLAVVTAVIAGAGFWVWRQDSGVVPGVLRMLLLTIPLLLLVSSCGHRNGMSFLTGYIPRYMLETDAFPSKDNFIQTLSTRI